MRKSALWCIPCAFFLVACVLNLIGCVQGTALAATVKPALLPLLAATTLAFLVGKDIPDWRPAGLLVAAQLFGCTGDVLLIPDGFFFFAGGMVAFLVGHICYMCLFGGQSWKGLSLWQWLIALVIMGAAVFGLVKLIGIEGALFWPMLVYGFGLMMLIFSALAGVLRMPRGNRATWWILLAGAFLFTFSDACIAMGTFGVMTFSLRHFVVMLTYLAAQSLLAVGGIRLILGK
ncbi:MAG: lysoplasmalogenase [Bacteroidales bacterium]|nr:lysoplasmalogenase [Bacteroidales bacterium]